MDLRIDVYHHFDPSPFCDPAAALCEPSVADILAALDQLKGLMMTTQQELAADLGAVAANVTKIGEETRTLLARIDELTAAVVAAGNTTPEVDAALQLLKEQVAVVDALVPDAAPPAEG